MTFDQMQKRALEILRQYENFEQKKFGRPWTTEELVLGFVGDVGTLAKLALAKGGVREVEGADEKLSHELADCLWSVIVIANKYNVPLEEVFSKTMDDLEGRIQTMMLKEEYS